MFVSIVVPVYNSPLVPELAERLDAVFAARRAGGDDYELILVDDASPRPDVWPALERLARERPQVRAFQLTRNFGQAAATLCGLRESRGDWVITLDDDLQHRPEDIPLLLERTDCDIVIGQLQHRQHSLYRRFLSRCKGTFDRLILGKPPEIQLSSFRLLSRSVVDGVLAIRTPHPFLPALMFYVSKNVCGVPVSHDRRRSGQSGYTLWKLISLFSNLLINNSSLVLRLVGHLGIAFSGVSFLIALSVVYQKVANGIPVRGWTSLFATLLLLGGLLLFGLGIVGEYLIRIIEGTEARPTYFVRRRVEAVKTPAPPRSPAPALPPSDR